MPSQPISRTAPSEGPSTARQAMADAIAAYLYKDGPAVARAHVEILGNEFSKIYGNEGQEAYREAMAQIAAYEEAERQKAAELQQQQFQKLVMTMISTIQPDQAAALPDSVNERMKRALDGLKTEKLLVHKYDYIWIMHYINEHHLKEIDLYFYSVNSYRDYIITQTGHLQVASISTLSQYSNYVDGRFPDWIFSDTNDSTERLRRINIVRRFAAVFVKGR